MEREREWGEREWREGVGRERERRGKGVGGMWGADGTRASRERERERAREAEKQRSREAERQRGRKESSKSWRLARGATGTEAEWRPRAAREA